MKATDTHILIVDDEPDILEILEFNLSKEGFQIHTAQNGKEALQEVEKQIPHLVILDMMMPEMNGIETCKKLRKKSALDQTLIAFLTARNEDFTQLKAYKSGADDYITKPVRPRVFVSKVKALIRRLPTKKSKNIVQINNLKINKENREVLFENNEMHLPLKEFDLLLLLAEKPGKVFTRKEIMNAVWGEDVVVGNRTIDVHIRKLRGKIGNEKIETVSGIGYKLTV